MFLSKKEKRAYYRRLRIKIYSLGGLFFLTMIFAAYGILNMSFFKIKNVETSGYVDLEKLRSEILKSDIAQFLGHNNFLSWPSEMGSAKIDKNYLEGLLKISNSNPEKFGIWCANECYWFNNSGKLTGLAPDTEGSSIPKVLGVLAESNQLKNIISIIENINALPVRIAYYSYDDRLQELTASGVKKEKIIFSTRFVPSEKTFGYVKDLLLKGELRRSEYLDLTVENRAYLKSL